MSLSSSETAVHVAPPRIAYMFLAHFDPKQGYKMEWASDPAAHDFAGLECKVLPSGVHEYEATSMYLAHEARGKLFYGCARFRQANLNPAGGLDRRLVKMYSLGILVEPLEGQYWTPHEFSAVGWEHLGALDQALGEFVRTGDLAAVQRAHRRLSGRDWLLDVPRPFADCQLDHPLRKLPATLSTVGPLLFPLFKAALLRKNILIFNHSSQGSAELVREPSPRGPAACAALAYVLALISVIPKTVRLDLPARGPGDSPAARCSRPLYTVGLQDMGSGLLAHHPGFIACTSDEILKYQTRMYDVAVMMPSSSLDTCLVHASEALARPIRATHNDYGMFLKVYRSLPQTSDGTQLSTGDDQSSIRTSSSDDKLRREPTWWLANATLPMSWREYIWLAFAWFASAGTTEREAGKINLDADTVPDGAPSSRDELLQLTSIVGHFHKLTKKWFYIIEEIIEETTGGPAADLASERVTLELTPQDMVDMELDPYSAQDLDFVREFVLTYWSTVIDDVEVGLGLHNFLC
ncbi:hypothetical protein METBIDRAFT_44619 [Metschnikowia bicuspidata var. bicuspidata NRRL YB-4993]|uniref:DUF4484 domain-containing protein n=1 Tax=Metschnikowia bicuspidata var. bicuspidata NRRL YB-4993 TaxID=869754 RepID=A0A1A0H789_9ASCO|nr:hypothetical protein METBIDRAFT_44619 [Metschnikowia bicuspidata var. bicuspidata NRRL YB-4993]OBA19762.1 hypothetical protein METBIDRAFT_44619 [Metschnikowia bicuspidata var. bicuspidata NRRL YB-4993]